MLEELHIQHLALIDEAWLEFAPGLTVLTGETGAGKTVLISALKLLLGARADAQNISPECDSARVEGQFFFDDEEVIVQRSVQSNGRSKCVLNAEMVPVKILQDVVGSRVDLHGQHDHQALLKASTHRALLDSYSEDTCGASLDAYQNAFKAYRAALTNLENLQEAADQKSEALEMNRLVLKEISRIDPLPGEDDELRAALPSLMHSEEIAQACDEVWSILTGENGVGDKLATAMSALERVVDYHESFAAWHRQLNALLIETSDIGASMRDEAQSVDRDPQRLDELQGRLKELDSLAKRFGPTLEDVLRKQEELEAVVDAVDNAEERLAHLKKIVDDAREVLVRAAAELHEKRYEAGVLFCQELKEALQDLALPHASFEMSFEPLEFDQWTQLGSEKVEILYSPVLKAPARPLTKIASGGEISRVMLALKTILGNKDDVEILVFDEIDAGIGGHTATSIGKRLKDLAITHQVLVITHLAQVAVFADKHYVVSKSTSGEKTQTSVNEVKDDDRIEEIARLLSGENSPIAFKHAEELLALAQNGQ